MIKQKRGQITGQPPSLLVESHPGQTELVEDTQSVRILGANIQHNMMWQSHLEMGPKALLPWVRQQLGLLKHLGDLIPMSSRKNLARGLIGSRMSYLMPLWGGGQQKVISGRPK